MAAARQHFCGDTLNIFGHEDQSFQWSIAYDYYSSTSAQKKVISTSEIAAADCVPDFFYFKDLVTCCAENYILNQRIIQMGNHSQVSLSPQVFRKMLTLPDPMPTFKGENCRQFLKKHGNELDLLPKFLQDPTPAPQDMAILQVSAFKNLFRQIAWLFTRITRQESATDISRMILYILYFTVKEQAIFHCGKLISIEISSQLLQYRRQKKFFMSSYLIFVVANCYPFPGLSMCKKLNSEFDPVTFSCQILWRHDACQHFYKVFNDFVSVFKALIFGKYFPRLSGQLTIFLDRKGTLEEMENYNVIRIFGSKQNPCFLPCHISGTMFFAGIAREYIYWLHFFHEKKKVNSSLCLGKSGISWSGTTSTVLSLTLS
jgi:hypothetical protein